MLQIGLYSLFGSVDDSGAYCTNDTITKYCFAWNVFTSHNNLLCCLKQIVFWKMTWGQNFTFAFMIYFCQLYGERFCTNVGGVLASFHEVIELKMTSYPRIRKTFHHWFSLHIFINFMKKKPSLNIYGVFGHFSQTYEITKPGMIKLCLDVSDAIHPNGHT